MDLIKTIEEEKIVVIVPGVKTEGETIADADMMRGEETELIGLMEHLESAAAAGEYLGAFSKEKGKSFL